MKKVIISVIILAGCHAAFLTGCKSKGTNRIEINGQVIEGENIVIPKPLKEEYHIMVYYSSYYYCVKFTNDNWESQEGILSCDKSGLHRMTFFDTKQEAIRVAKPLDTYEKAVRYNDSIRNNCSPEYIKIH